MSYVEDPSIAYTAAAEADRLWGRIEARVKRGEWFFRAREVVLAEEVRDISIAYGRTVATRVQRSIQSRPPISGPPWPELIAHVEKQRGFRRAVNRLWMGWTGYPLI